MKSIKLILILLLFSCAGYAQNDTHNQDFENLISSYENALINKNTKDILSLFTADGVLVLQGSPTCIGAEAIETFYNNIFKVIDFNLTFNIAEVVQLSPDWAFIRTSTHKRTSQTKKEEAHEIFIVTKTQDNLWKIARYAGSSSL